MAMRGVWLLHATTLTICPHHRKGTAEARGAHLGLSPRKSVLGFSGPFPFFNLTALVKEWELTGIKLR